MSLEVRAASVLDAQAIVAFQCAMAEETEDKALDRERVTRGVRAVFDGPERGRYLVADVDGETVASLMLTLEWSDWRDGWFWWIQSVFVAPDHRRTGIYRAMYAEVLRQAEARPDVCGVRLYVERENERAHRVYEALGMTRSGYQFFEVDFVLGTGANGAG